MDAVKLSVQDLHLITLELIIRMLTRKRITKKHKLPPGTTYL